MTHTWLLVAGGALVAFLILAALAKWGPTKYRQWTSLLGRKIRLTIAGVIVKPLGCTTVSAELMLQIGKKIAELDSYIEKSAEIQHRKHAYTQLVTRLQEIGQMVTGAVRIGDPNMSVEDLVNTYMQARWNSMSRNQQRKIQRQRAAQEMAKLPPRPPKAVAVPATEPV